MACVGAGDEAVVDVLSVDDDDREVGTIGVEDGDVVRVVDIDEGTAPVGRLIEDGSVDLFDAVYDVVFVTAVAEFCALHSAWKK